MGSSMQPGFVAGRTADYREILFSDVGARTIPAMTIDSTKAYDGKNTGFEEELRLGCIMGMITASKKWRPCPRTLSNGAGAPGTALIVDDARFFKINDVITVGDDTTKTVTGINYATNTLTIASTTWADNEAVFVEDGSATARGVLSEGVKMRDSDNVVRDKSAVILVAGFFLSGQILGDLTNILAATHKLGFCQFDSDHGMT